MLLQKLLFCLTKVPINGVKSRVLSLAYCFHACDRRPRATPEGEDGQVGFNLDELQERWQSLGVVAAAEGGGYVYHLW